MPKKIKQQHPLLEAMDKYTLTREDFEKNFSRVLKFLNSLKEKNQGEFSSLNKKWEEFSSQLADGNKTELGGMNKSLNDLFTQLSNKLNKILDDRIALIKNGKDADEEKVSIIASERALEAVKPMIPTTSTLKKDISKMGKLIRKILKKKLKISDIKGLRKELDKLKKSSGMIVGGGSGTGGHIVKAYDLSASLNGVLKTFTIPAFWRIISVHSSSFPNAFRPTTDYTVNGSTYQITFTSEINAATTLASGQTIIVTYSE